MWEQLAHDMIVVACGWQTHPDRLPRALSRHASILLGEQLRRDIGVTSDWAVHAQTIVKWLARTGLVTVILPPEETSAWASGPRRETQRTGVRSLA